MTDGLRSAADMGRIETPVRIDADAQQLQFAAPLTRSAYQIRSSGTWNCA